jgi:phosphopantothenoylcysteine decarboxylase / phosphopantothenate---cysteine ligase
VKTILIGITGGIAAYKSLELVKRLKRAGVNPVVIMTQSAQAIVSPEAFEAASGNRVYTQLFAADFDYKKILQSRVVEHIRLAHTAVLFVIVPATANVMAKLACGIADDFLTTTALAVKCPVLLCPSMNTTMWFHPATQRNIQTLLSWGYSILGPESGALACADVGKGRLPPVEYIENEILKYVRATNDLKGKTVIVTAGGTTEKIDDVRYISNRSSGKMGVAIAESCFLHGAHVILIRSNSSVLPRYSIPQKIFETADELERLLQKYLPRADVCFHVAAVSDYTLKHPLSGKTSSNKPLPLELTVRSKILDKIKSINPRIFLVAFKAEWNVSEKQLITLSKKRLEKSRTDIIIANDVGKKNQGFESDTNEVYVIDSKGITEHFPKMNKSLLAAQILSYLIKKKLLTV